MNIRVIAPIIALALCAATLTPSRAHADNISISGGTVTLIEATYLPGSFNFRLTSGDAVCPAGSWLQYEGRSTDNTKAVYATILAAYLAGKPVYAYYSTDNVHSSVCASISNCCVVTFVGVQ